jgi:superfamily II DNA or RNA helicase
MNATSADDVRAAIAALVLGNRHATSELGAITLHAHQREGLERVTQLLARHGGALLADDVGFGKTFVALAAARDARNPVVVAPAALRDGWTVAAKRAGVALRFVSVEMLGRRAESEWEADFVVIDEAHHLRSSRTRRFAAASTLCSGAKVLLMSATPVQNRLADVRTILSLFLGERAHAMPEDELARFIVRRVESDVAESTTFALPRVRTPRWVSSVTDVDCLDRLLALPPPLPPADGADGGVLLTYTLARQWASSRAALRSALQRRLARASAMEDALAAGRLPSRAELAAWCYAEGAQQLTFPELAVRAEVPETTAFLVQVRHHAFAVRELLGWLETSADPDRARAAALRDLATAHAGERIIAFSEYTDTVTSLYRLLAPTVRAAMLTHGGGRVAGGSLTRRELLQRFAPGASARTPESDRVDLLLTTDVLSEGVNLQDASVVVHLDLSWNPARLEQRVGRLRRAGAARESIAVYMFAPPAPTERLLQLERRLRCKLDVAARSIGVAGVILPGLATPDARDASAAREERIVATLRRWSRADWRAPGDLPCAAVESTREGAIACVRFAGDVRLVALAARVVTDSRDVIEELLGCARGSESELNPREARAAKERIESWMRRRVVSGVVDLPALRIARSRRALLHRVETIARRAPRHTQSQLAPLMHAARTAATATLSAGAERVLDELVYAPLKDEAWLHAIGEFAALHARRDAGAPEVLALLVLRKN